MRVTKGCARCRHRHARCVVPVGASSCSGCARLGRPCHLEPRFHFKPVRHIYQQCNNAPTRFDLVWDEQQVWVGASRPVTFVCETDDFTGERFESDDRDQDVEQQYSPPSQNQPTPPDPIEFNSTDNFTRKQFELEDRNQDLEQSYSPPGQNHTTPPDPPEFNQNLEQSYSPPGQNHTTPPDPTEFNPTDDSSNHSPVSGTNDVSSPSPREAYLIRSYIQKIAAVADICEPRAYFSTELPRRALEEPMLLKALLALAARHDAILTDGNESEASIFHGECLQLLIVALNQPEENYDDNLLATVVVLRFYEELERTADTKCHLLGSNRLLNLMSRSASSGGLAEALDLRNYERSSVFHRDDDAARANVIIFFCACILQLCCTVPGYAVDRKSWRRLADCVEEWHCNKPRSWQPLRYQAHVLSDDQPFPELWILSPPAVVGLQYYHASKIFLTLSDAPSQRMTDYEMSQARLIAEVCSRHTPWYPSSLISEVENGGESSRDGHRTVFVE
ncbi:uncharacterized protein N7515_001930 [Penicillium bovifimosum]|uniref:Zn(2)-C6 fungal-type domain-containing protein n=1 Tax=Penicillium bovifimosum TaxID=126998 RepID=A0A9W9HAT6_9EURO|nr:uncharacterized protein N7515_001930 [Penicillium bovifimosum]KAJ5143143.1 hypothetical protein N7515_001930 [Penicillium bovifimosum]